MKLTQDQKDAAAKFVNDMRELTVDLAEAAAFVDHDGVVEAATRIIAKTGLRSVYDSGFVGDAYNRAHNLRRECRSKPEETKNLAEALFHTWDNLAKEVAQSNQPLLRIIHREMSGESRSTETPAL